jgi:protocatechuate 3,4-dioxygenase beta subunit
MSDHDHHSEVEDHDRGLSYDLQNPRHRRAFLGLVGAGAATVGGAVLLGTSGGPAAGSADPVAEIPSETGGPFPGDGSNGPNALAESGIIRSDIRRSFGSSTTKALGQKFQFKLRLVDTADLGPLTGYAVYAWHCNRDGGYSMYGSGITGENYLRGVQVSNARGIVRFKSIYPACYSGRWPHIHFEVYASAAEATKAGQIVRTSQLALPKDVCSTVYATDGYDGSAQNLSQTSLDDDNVFGDDDGVHQLATVTGDVSKGYVATLTVGV